MKILVINAGSSSLKYQLFDMENGDVLAKGLCECIGDTMGSVTHKRGEEKYKMEVELPDHEVALSIVLDLLVSAEHGVIESIDEIGAVGHRVAHGGEKFKASTLIDEETIRLSGHNIMLAFSIDSRKSKRLICFNTVYNG